MEIKFSNASESVQEINNVLWKVTSKKRLIFLIVLLMISVALSVYGAIHSKEYSKSSSAYSESNVQILSINHYSNRHIAESIGVVAFLFIILLLKFHYEHKKIFFNKVKAIDQRFLETDNQYTITIDEDHIVYDSVDLYLKATWVKFSSYRLYGNFIFIGFGEFSHSFTVDTRLISEIDLEVLLKLFKSKNLRKLK